MESWKCVYFCVFICSANIFPLDNFTDFCRNLPFADTFFKSRMKTINLESKLLHVMTDCLDATAVFNREFEVAKA